MKRLVGAILLLGLLVAGCGDRDSILIEPRPPGSFLAHPDTPAALFLDLEWVYDYRDWTDLGTLLAPGYHGYLRADPASDERAFVDTASYGDEMSITRAALLLGRHHLDIHILSTEPAGALCPGADLASSVHWECSGILDADTTRVHGDARVFLARRPGDSGTWQVLEWWGPSPTSLVSWPDASLPLADPPTLVRMVDPVYPPAARSGGITGQVTVALLVDPEGRVAGTKIVRGVPELNQALVDAVNQWLFKPADVNGRRIPMWIRTSWRFQ